MRKDVIWQYTLFVCPVQWKFAMPRTGSGLPFQEITSKLSADELVKRLKVRSGSVEVSVDTAPAFSLGCGHVF